MNKKSNKNPYNKLITNISFLLNKKFKFYKIRKKINSFFPIVLI